MIVITLAAWCNSLLICKNMGKTDKKDCHLLENPVVAQSGLKFSVETLCTTQENLNHPVSSPTINTFPSREEKPSLCFSFLLPFYFLSYEMKLCQLFVKVLLFFPEALNLPMFDHQFSQKLKLLGNGTNPTLGITQCKTTKLAVCKT